MSQGAASAVGRFVVLEGMDGCGKSTQARRLVERLRAHGRSVVHTREPGGTPAGERIRALLLDPALGEVDALTEVLLYQAARRQLVTQVVRPALARGEVVVCERWHYATQAYQGAAGGASAEDVRTSSRLATGGLEPDRAVLLDLDDAGSQARMQRERDRIEARGVAYRQRVAEGFRTLFAADPQRMRVVAAAGTPDEVEARVWEAVRDLF
ncbi:MAG: dTMP kinase [Planctomycetia bacterium]